LQERAELAACHLDALNHILEPRKLRQVFAREAGILNPGGLFQFDLDTGHWFRRPPATEACRKKTSLKSPCRRLVITDAPALGFKKR
jgi:hypothetical protein